MHILTNLIDSSMHAVLTDRVKLRRSEKHCSCSVYIYNTYGMVATIFYTGCDFKIYTKVAPW